jgi:hypothetical protein
MLVEEYFGGPPERMDQPKIPIDTGSGSPYDVIVPFIAFTGGIACVARHFLRTAPTLTMN